MATEEMRAKAERLVDRLTMRLGEPGEDAPIIIEEIASALHEARNEALEEAAVVCEAHSQKWDQELDRIDKSMRENPVGPPGVRDWEHSLGRKHEAARCATAIRSLKTPEGEAK